MRIYILTIALLASIASQAQQDPQYSQYMFNMLSVNPGYAGNRNVLSVTALHRNQWMNIEGAPKTSTVTADMPVANNKLGIGVSFINDKIGRFDNNTFNVYLAYRLKVSSRGTLGMGLSGGVNVLQAQLSNLRANSQGTSETLFQDYNKTSPTLGVGFFYNTDRFYLGLSAPSLFNNYQSTYSADKSLLRKFQHYFVTAGYVLNLSPEVKAKPSVMAKSALGAPVALDLNLNFWLHDVLGIGASYRLENSVVGLIEIQAARQLRIGYALDYPINDLKNENGKTPLTHEFLLRLEFGKQNKKVLSPRYF